VDQLHHPELGLALGQCHVLGRALHFVVQFHEDRPLRLQDTDVVGLSAVGLGEPSQFLFLSFAHYRGQDSPGESS
jgi:hypothetical protein